MTRLLPQIIFTVALGTGLVLGADTAGKQTQWVRVEHTDPKSGTRSAAYALTGQTADSERRPSIVLTCDGDREPTLVYHAEVKLAGQAHNVYNRYADSIWAYVKVDDNKPYRALWEMIPGPDNAWNLAAIDKRTLRHLFSGRTMRVRFRDSRDEEHLDEFYLPGLTVSDLEPFCAAKWLDKNDLTNVSRSSRLSRH